MQSFSTCCMDAKSYEDKANLQYLFKLPIHSIRTAWWLVEYNFSNFPKLKMKNLTITSTSRSDWTTVWVKKGASVLTSSAGFFHSLDNYFCHFICVQLCATLWMPSSRDWLKMCGIIFNNIASSPSLWCAAFHCTFESGQFRTLSKHFSILMWSDNTSYGPVLFLYNPALRLSSQSAQLPTMYGL